MNKLTTWRWMIIFFDGKTFIHYGSVTLNKTLIECYEAGHKEADIIAIFRY